MESTGILNQMKYAPPPLEFNRGSESLDLVIKFLFFNVKFAIWTVRMLREELQLLQEPGSYVGEVVKVMGKNKVLVKV